jgi:membrane glycosyltransferase
MLLLTTLEGIRQTVIPHRYFEPGDPLFPKWPVSIAEQAIGLFLLILTFLLLPKLLSLLLHFRRSLRSARAGSRLKLASSVFLETLLSSLLAPNLALLQSRFVVSILMGSNTKWEAQDRGDSGTTWGEAARRHWPATVLGMAWTVLLAFTASKLLPWFAPVLLGFLLAIPLSVWTSRPTWGLAARRRGLFMIPEEIHPPQVLRDFDSALRQVEQVSWASPENGLERVLKLPELYELHLAAVGDQPKPADPLKRHELDGLALKCRHEGAHSLSKQERRELLLHPWVLERLRSENTIPSAA